MRADIIIKNGHIMDPAAGNDLIADVAVQGTRMIVAEHNMEAKHVIDASGCYVFPGLIDYHTHLYYEGSGLAIRPDFMVAQGTTSACDAGTAGCANFESYYRTVVVPSTVRIKSYMTIYSGGQLDFNIVEDFDPKLFNEARIRKMAEKFPDQIQGFKIRLSKGIVPEGETALEPLKRTVELAEKIGNGLRVCVHTTNSPVPAEKLAECLRPGDVFCHCYQGAGNTILDENGHIRKGIWKARKRGVIFDAANGKGNFSVEVAIKALAEGFYPDVISTDLTTDKFNMPPYCKNLPTLMSKYLTLGMDLMEVLRRVTENPAKLMGMEGQIGTLAPGAYADIAIFKKKEIPVIHKDFRDTELKGNVLLLPQMTICGGEIQYCQTDFYY